MIYGLCFCSHLGARCWFGIGFRDSLESKLCRKWSKGQPKCINKLGLKKGERPRLLFFCLLAPFDRFGVPYWRLLDFEGVCESKFFDRISINYQKMARLGAVPEKTCNNNWNWCDKDGPGDVKKRFRRSRNLIENEAPKGIQNLSKIDHLGDFVNFLDWEVFRQIWFVDAF